MANADLVRNITSRDDVDVIGCNNFSSWIFWDVHQNMLMTLNPLQETFVLSHRPNGVVCQSVGRSVTVVSPANCRGWTDWDAVWVEDLGGPRKHVGRWDMGGGDAAFLSNYFDHLFNLLTRRYLPRNNRITDWLYAAAATKKQVVKVIWHKAASPQQTDGSVVFARWRHNGTI